MAQMSKELAAICTDCPVEFNYEDTRIDNFYTPEAYRYMKRLEFKSILSRFDATSMGDTSASSLEDHFTLIRDEKSAAEVFAKRPQVM